MGSFAILPQAKFPYNCTVAGGNEQRAKQSIEESVQQSAF
jgi:hypothetical protein